MLLATLTTCCAGLPGQSARTIPMRFDVTPSKARIYLLDSAGLEYLGTADTTLQIPASEVEDKGGGGLYLTRQVRIELDGYTPQTLVLPGTAFRQGRWPPAGEPACELRPANWRGWLAAHRTLVSLFAVALVALLAGLPVHRRRAAEKSRRLRLADEIVRDTISGIDPLVKSQAWLGNYQIRTLIAAGGMGTVYRARDREGTEWALKIINAGLLDDEYLRRLRREFKVGVSLDHPNLIRFKEMVDDDPSLPTYMVTEFVNGQTLQARMGGRQLSHAEIIGYFDQIVRGVAHAHTRGVVHRDLKPSNILVTDNGRIKILDFGIARKHDLSVITMADQTVGTPAYMAPEQVRSQPTTPATDQYALGVLLFEMLTGRLPYEGDAGAIMSQHLDGAPPSLASLRPDSTAELEVALLRMLAVDPTQRYPDVQAAWHAVRRTLGDSPGGKEPPTPGSAHDQTAPWDVR
jgi:hypothetical protein